MDYVEYYIGGERIDFDSVITPELVAGAEAEIDSRGLKIEEGRTVTDLFREYFASYCGCVVHRHPDGVFAVIEMCIDHEREAQAVDNARARRLLEQSEQ